MVHVVRQLRSGSKLFFFLKIFPAGRVFLHRGCHIGLAVVSSSGQDVVYAILVP